MQSQMEKRALKSDVLEVNIKTPALVGNLTV